MEQKKTLMDYDTVSLDDESSAVVIIDQTKLPGTTEIIALKTAQEIWDAESICFRYVELRPSA